MIIRHFLQRTRYDRTHISYKSLITDIYLSYQSSNKLRFRNKLARPPSPFPASPRTRGSPNSSNLRPGLRPAAVFPGEEHAAGRPGTGSPRDKYKCPRRVRCKRKNRRIEDRKVRWTAKRRSHRRVTLGPQKGGSDSREGTQVFRRIRPAQRTTIKCYGATGQLSSYRVLKLLNRSAIGSRLRPITRMIRN